MPSEHMLEQVIVWGSDWVSWKTFFSMSQARFRAWVEGRAERMIVRRKSGDKMYKLFVWCALILVLIYAFDRDASDIAGDWRNLEVAWPRPDPGLAEVKLATFLGENPFSAVKLNFVRSPASKSESTWYRKGNRRFLLLPERGKKKLRKVI